MTLENNSLPILLENEGDSKPFIILQEYKWTYNIAPNGCIYNTPDGSIDSTERGEERNSGSIIGLKGLDYKNSIFFGQTLTYILNCFRKAQALIAAQNSGLQQNLKGQ